MSGSHSSDSTSRGAAGIKTRADPNEHLGNGVNYSVVVEVTVAVVVGLALVWLTARVISHRGGFRSVKALWARLRGTPIPATHQKRYSSFDVEGAALPQDQLQTQTSVYKAARLGRHRNAVPKIVETLHIGTDGNHPVTVLPAPPSRPTSAVHAEQDPLSHLSSLHASMRADIASRSTHPLARPETAAKRHSASSSCASFHTASRGSLSAGEDDAGYISDMTMSTLPPSYRRHRSIPDQSVPLPSPSAAPSRDLNTANLAFPPSAFMRSGRRLRDVVTKARSGGSGSRRRSSERRDATLAAYTQDAGGFGNVQDSSVERAQSRQPKKSTDGGVRLAGGPLDMPPEDGLENPHEDFAVDLDCASLTSAPSYHTES